MDIQKRQLLEAWLSNKLDKEREAKSGKCIYSLFCKQCLSPPCLLDLMSFFYFIQELNRVEWQSRLNISKPYISMNLAVKSLKLILRSFEILNYGLKPLKFQKVEDFKEWKCLDDSTKWVYLDFTHCSST